MSVLQWALLILGGIAVITVYVVSRREKPPVRRPSALLPEGRVPPAEQAELFGVGKFDEFGVGKPRKRTAPMFGGEPQDSLFEESDAEAPPKPVAAPASSRKAPSLQAAPSPAAAPARSEEKIIALLIAEREGTAIYGSKLHAALQQQKLQFGERQIYHRMEQGMIVFSVASLLKPGTLDPAESADFSTPGLSVFMVLPGPVKPVAAFQDMIATARALARSINAELFDAQRQPFSGESERMLKAEVESWARANHLA